MALVPIPYTKNWKDVFGSQFVPTLANAGAAAFVAPPAITSANTNAAGLCTVVATRAGAGRIDWGDGSALAVMPASGNMTHTYTRKGNFGITIYTDADPTARATTRTLFS